MTIKDLISECSAYDFKEMLEEKKPKSWLKSVSSFANGLGGSLFFGVDDDGVIRGLKDMKHDTEAISLAIKDKMDPLPDVEMIPLKEDGMDILQVKVHSGRFTPYYYVGDGQRVAFERVGDESVPASAEQMMALVLKGSNRTWDSLPTDQKAADHSFLFLANAFKERVQQHWDEKLLLSFGLMTSNGMLTNAGRLFMDGCDVYNSRLFCTCWTGTEKDDALDSKEFKGNVLELLRDGLLYMKSFTKSGWVKLPTHRLNLPDYAERALMEGLVNHLIHRDYAPMGSEVHLDIYDDRLTLTSPGGMIDGTIIQNQDISKVSSSRRNPILAEVFAQLDYMEKRGSGLRRMREATSVLPNYTEDKQPQYESNSAQFVTTFYNVNWRDGARIPLTQSLPQSGDDGIPKEYTESVPKKYTKTIGKPLGKTAQAILDMVVANSEITASQVVAVLGISLPAVKKQFKSLQEKGLIRHEGPSNGGRWIVVVE